MTMIPVVYDSSLFDDVDREFVKSMERAFLGSSLFSTASENRMKTDVRDKDGSYEVDIDLPGFRKEDVKVQLDQGYLTVSASRKESKDEKNSKGGFIRRERWEGSCSRSFYVGSGVKKDDISAKMEDGVLRLTLPKKSEKAVEEARRIMIA
jgi:HSP20 family protein